MIGRRTFWIALLWLGAAGIVAAQAPGSPHEAERTALGLQDKPTQAGMYEDIEIMRRILNRKLQGLYSPWKVSVLSGADDLEFHRRLWLDLYGTLPPPDSFFTLPKTEDTLLSTWLDRAKVAPTLNTEGVYLKGQGVVYTLTLPPRDVMDAKTGKVVAPAGTCASCHGDPFRAANKPKPPAKAPSLWDQVRQEVRGQKDDPKKEPAPPKESEICAPGTLAENVLRVLADNGHNFSKLGDNESLTVVITFRDDGDQLRWLYPAQGHLFQSNLPLNSFQLTPAANTFDTLRFPTPLTTTMPFGTQPKTTGQPAEPPPTKPTTARDYELLGDLHHKQGRTQEAIDAYKKAVDSNPDARQAAAIYRKLAQLYLTLEKDAQAEEAIKKGLEWLRKHYDAGGGADTGAGALAHLVVTKAPPPAVPSKLMISVSKKLLDLAGSGKIGFEELKKGATVEYLSFPATEKKPTGTAPK